jgi:uncharacterized protein (DUF58 family)
MAQAPLLDRPFLERLERLTLQWQKAFSGLVGGHSPSRFSGAGQEFLDHRNFHDGDDLRNVNWRMFLRLERMFSKVFHLEPRIPIRLLIDVSASMGTDPLNQNNGGKLLYAKQLAAAICYTGLARLDSITVHPFHSRLLEPIRVTGGRHRYQAVQDSLAELTAAGHSEFDRVMREFLERYDRPGLVFVVSDFLGSQEIIRPLEFLSEFGHELTLIQVFDPEDRQPTTFGELDLTDAESGETLQLQFDEAAAAEYRLAFDEHSRKLANLAGQGGRYLSFQTDHPIEEVFAESMMRARGAA